MQLFLQWLLSLRRPQTILHRLLLSWLFLAVLRQAPPHSIAGDCSLITIRDIEVLAANPSLLFVLACSADIDVIRDITLLR